jgi:hypothetical protein
MNDDNPTAAEEAIACLLSEREQAERGDQIAHDLFPGARAIEELPDGYAFNFPADDEWTTRVLVFVAAERRCCPFFTFELVFEPHGRALWLRLRGSPAIKAFVRENFPIPAVVLPVAP